MVELLLSDIVELEIITQDNVEFEWIKYTPETNLNDFEKINSSGSSDTYIIRSIADPKVHMGVKREEFVQSVFFKRNEKLMSAPGRGGTYSSRLCQGNPC